MSPNTSSNIMLHQIENALGKSDSELVDLDLRRHFVISKANLTAALYWACEHRVTYHK